MAMFTFGQVEAVLADLNEIATDKRVAFSARLKNLQKQGLQSTGSTPGRGKAASLRFGEMMQMALAVDLLRLGLPPQRAAELVRRNWAMLRYSVYQSTYTQAEMIALAEHEGETNPTTTWIWLVRNDALAELTTLGVSDFDTYEAIDVISLEGFGSLVDTLANSDSAIDRRTLLINGTQLTREIVGRADHMFRYATPEEMREDIYDEIREQESKMKLWLDTIDGNPPAGVENAIDLISITRGPEYAKAVESSLLKDAKRKISTLEDADSLLGKQVLRNLSRNAVNLLVLPVLGGSSTHFVMNEEVRAALHELVDKELIRVHDAQSTLGQAAAPTFTLTRLGQALADYEVSMRGGKADVSS